MALAACAHLDLLQESGILFFVFIKCEIACHGVPSPTCVCVCAWWTATVRSVCFMVMYSCEQADQLPEIVSWAVSVRIHMCVVAGQNALAERPESVRYVEVRL